MKTVHGFDIRNKEQVKRFMEMGKKPVCFCGKRFSNLDFLALHLYRRHKVCTSRIPQLLRAGKMPSLEKPF